MFFQNLFCATFQCAPYNFFAPQITKKPASKVARKPTRSRVLTPASI